MSEPWALAEQTGGAGRRGRSLMDTVQSEVIQSPCGTLEAGMFSPCVCSDAQWLKKKHTHIQRVESQDQTLEVGSEFTTGA